MTSEKQVSDRRRFVRKLFSVAALGAVSSLLLGTETKEARGVNPAGTGILIDNGNGSFFTDPQLNFNDATNSDTDVPGLYVGSSSVSPGSDDIFIGFDKLQSGTPAFTGTNSLFVANNSGDIDNTFRVDGYENELDIIGDSAAGALTGTAIGFRTAQAGQGEIDRVKIDQLYCALKILRDLSGGVYLPAVTLAIVESDEFRLSE